LRTWQTRFGAARLPAVFCWQAQLAPSNAKPLTKASRNGIVILAKPPAYWQKAEMARNFSSQPKARRSLTA
jgi:hypothetical protein